MMSKFNSLMREMQLSRYSMETLNVPSEKSSVSRHIAFSKRMSQRRKEPLQLQIEQEM